MKAKIGPSNWHPSHGQLRGGGPGRRKDRCAGLAWGSARNLNQNRIAAAKISASRTSTSVLSAHCNAKQLPLLLLLLPLLLLLLHTHADCIRLLQLISDVHEFAKHHLQHDAKAASATFAASAVATMTAGIAANTSDTTTATMLPLLCLMLLCEALLAHNACACPLLAYAPRNSDDREFAERQPQQDAKTAPATSAAAAVAATVTAAIAAAMTLAANAAKMPLLFQLLLYKMFRAHAAHACALLVYDCCNYFLMIMSLQSTTRGKTLDIRLSCATSQC